jgi:FKBP-type peptidyl-prolyl cis-trans isomerase
MFASEAPALEVDAVPNNPFDSYDATSPSQKTIAIKDVSVGSGSEVVDAKKSSSQLLQLQYTAKLMNSKFSANLKQFDTPSMVFQTGEQRCLPGLEEGIIGMKVGGRRLVRVPPNKGYGDNWYRGVVPPNSHLEFDVTVVQVASGPVEEFQMKLEQFGVERALGAAVCLAYLALSPMIEKSGIFG